MFESFVYLCVCVLGFVCVCVTDGFLCESGVRLCLWVCVCEIYVC